MEWVRTKTDYMVRRKTKSVDMVSFFVTCPGPAESERCDLLKNVQTEDFDMVRFCYNTPINKKITR